MKLKRRCPNCHEKTIKGFGMKLSPHIEKCSNCGCKVRRSKITGVLLCIYTLSVLILSVNISGVKNSILIPTILGAMMVIVDFKFVPLIIVDHNKDKPEI